MSKLSKVIFLFLITGFSFLIVSPALKHRQNTTDIIFFSAGKADATLIVNKDVTILIDTGLRANRKILADSLKSRGIKKIDYLILTHPDKDHIGGASYILDTFIVENLIQSQYEKGSKDESRIINSLKERPVNNIILKEDLVVEYGDFKIDFLVSKYDKSKKSNDNSIVTLIKDRDLNYLFAADAAEALLFELLENDLPLIDLYKLPHHGRYNKESINMINKIKPKITVVTNDSADQNIEGALAAINSEVYYTFFKEVHISSDGKSLKVR